MKKGTFIDPTDHSSDSKRRKILALTPPPDIFLFNSEEISESGKDLDLKLNIMNEKREDSVNMYPSALGVTSCDSSRNSSLKKSSESVENQPADKKQLCDLDFFKIMSEDDEDASSNSVLNLFNSSRYYDVAQQNQDNNMNNLTKELEIHHRKYEMGKSNNMGIDTPLSSVAIPGDDTKGRTNSINSHYFSKSSSPSSVGTEKFYGAPPNKTVFNCPPQDSSIFPPPKSIQKSNSNKSYNPCSSNHFSNYSANKRAVICDICHEKFEYDYLLWIHNRIHIPKEQRLLCSFCPFVTSRSYDPTSSHGGGISLLTSHIRNTHFKAIQCRVCKVFVAESRAEMSRHVYRAHMYDKKFYTKQFRDLVQNQSTKNVDSGTRRKIHPAAMAKMVGNTQIGSRRHNQKSQNNFHHQQNVYCVL